QLRPLCRCQAYVHQTSLVLLADFSRNPIRDEYIERQRVYLLNTVIPVGETYRTSFSQVLGER
ncbi:hypothetical protein, partial [Hymenobacter sp. UV11]|uniref:hypothetical protein n=1 Tax=Hymenobacter sp. UV11 TaxID=1849735 RepID=UPI00196B823B